jgi:hypothetical protein
MATNLGGATMLFTPNSVIANLVFYDDVYFGYIPTNPAPDFTLPKDILEMTPQEKIQALTDFTTRQKDTLKQDKQRRLATRCRATLYRIRHVVEQARSVNGLATG